MLLIKGYIPNSLIKVIDNATKNYQESKSIVLKSLKKYQIQLFDNIWKERNNKMLEMERHFNITRKQKKQKLDSTKADLYKEKKNAYPITTHHFVDTLSIRWIYKSIIYGNSYKDFIILYNIFVVRIY